MKIKLETLKQVLKKGFYYLLFIITIIVTFYVGFYSNQLITTKESKPYSSIYQKNVTLALDQYDNLLIIDKKTGNYILYEDSIGRSIFIMYANKVSNTP